MTVAAKQKQTEVDFAFYDRIIVGWSGGKDSLACILDLLDRGVPKEKIELWHHDIDGREGSTLMDWPITADYCRAVAAALDLPILFSWKQGGFEGEMLRENALTAPTNFETPEGEVLETGGKLGKLNTRRKFPQVSADLTTRWCSAYLKIDVCTAAFRNDPRFQNSKILLVTGERGEESCSRANYAAFEPHKADLRNGRKFTRHVDQYRPVHHWPEERVWEIIERYRINPHPAYHLGWGRVSCLACIFGSKNQWASVRRIAPEHFARIASYEQEFDCTINRSMAVGELAAQGEPYADMDPSMIELAMSHEYTATVILDRWELPTGAFGESTGPT